MAAVPGYQSRVVVGDFAFSAYITDVSEPFTAGMFDVTVNASPDHAREYIAGQSESMLSLKGFLDPDGTAGGQYDQINNWLGNSEIVSYGPSGLTFGSEVVMSNGLLIKSQYDGNVTAPIGFSVDAQNSGQLDRGVSLHDLTAETADASSSVYDGGAASSNGGIIQLHVTDYSGLDSIDVIVEDSTNGSTGWGTIGTFTTATGITSERVTIAGAIKRYVRCSWDVTGTGSASFLTGFARR